MEFTEIWLQGNACLANAEHKQANKCFGIFNRHLIALNIKQIIVITGILYINAATVNRGKVHTNGSLTYIFAFVWPTLGWNGWVYCWDEVVLICSLDYEFYGLPQWWAHKTTASSLIQHGRPAEHHLLPKKLLIKSQLSFCKHFIENKISKLISCKSSPWVRVKEEEGKGQITKGRSKPYDSRTFCN